MADITHRWARLGQSWFKVKDIDEGFVEIYTGYNQGNLGAYVKVRQGSMPSAQIKKEGLNKMVEVTLPEWIIPDFYQESPNFGVMCSLVYGPTNRDCIRVSTTLGEGVLMRDDVLDPAYFTWEKPYISKKTLEEAIEEAVEIMTENVEVLESKIKSIREKIDQTHLKIETLRTRGEAQKNRHQE